MECLPHSDTAQTASISINGLIAKIILTNEKPEANMGFALQTLLLTVKCVQKLTEPHDFPIGNQVRSQQWVVKQLLFHKDANNLP